ncbi:hypothetical protein PGT21_008726 [Puccinia graminis f. sp. tritici]|uniref:Uncharacterized protein n=1 Tax=Puccinia graminis f. sp. tritici TaxID=56615 RepID=A0A5B0NV16_PUCGR|nr:hypothetical protein PGT21_008726 [Puccinia graminis f. sp. tritici]
MEGSSKNPTYGEFLAFVHEIGSTDQEIKSTREKYNSLTLQAEIQDTMLEKIDAISERFDANVKFEESDKWLKELQDKARK